jgi:hypothetical protein
MLKYMVLLSSLAPSIAMAHDWDNDYWLERLMRNHVKVGECLTYMYENAREDFMENCSVHAIGYTENDLSREYHQQLAKHPEQGDVEFVFEHFPEHDAEETVNIYQNAVIIPVINSAILTMYIADAIIRTDARMEDK